MRPLLAAVLQILLLSACFARPAEILPHEAILGGEGIETRPVDIRALFRFGRAGDLVNADFQSIAGGEPVGWNRRVGPELRSEGSNRFVRVNASSFYEQRLVQPAAGQHMTFSINARGETGRERAGLQTVQWNGANGQTYTTRAEVGTEFSRQFAPFPLLPGFTELELRVRAAGDREWIDADDALLLDEGLENGGLEMGAEHWTFEGNASLVADSIGDGGAQALRLNAGGRAAQFTAAMFDGQEYFAAGALRAENDDAALLVSEEWLAPGGSLQGAPFAGAVPAGSIAARFLVQTGNRENAAASRIALENLGPGGLTLDDLSRGSTFVFPGDYFPGTNSANPMLQLIAVWPRQIESGVVEIRNASDALVDSVPLSLDRGAGSASWNGEGQPGGTYTARFTLTNASSTTLTIDRPFTLHDSFSVAENDAFTTDVIGRGVWLWMIPEENLDAARAAASIAAAQEDGFNLGVIWALEEQWPAIVEACAQRHFSFIPANLDLNNAVKESARVGGFNRADYIDLVNRKVGPAIASPWCIGYYLMDEPFTDLDVQRAAAAHGIAGVTPAWKRPFMIIWGPAAVESKWDAIRPIIHMTDYYPWTVDMQDMTAGLRDFSARVAEQVAIARARNRAYWAWPQVFATPEYWRSPNAGATRSTIGITLARGGTGYVLFAYLQIGGVEGLRTRELDPLPETAVWREENARIAAHEDVLLRLTDHREPISASGPLLVTLADDPEGGAVVFAVSLESRRDIGVQFTFSESQNALVEITGGEPLPAFETSASATLGPGEWRAWYLPAGTVTAASATIAGSVPTFELPRLVDLTYNGTAILDIAFNGAGDRIALAGDAKALVLDDLGGILAQPALSRTQRVAFESNDVLLLSDNAFGVNVYDVRTMSPLAGFLRHTGAAFETLPTPSGTIWLTMSEWGLRRLTRAAGGTFTFEPPTGTNGLAQSLFGPFADESVLLLNADEGISHATPNGAVFIAGEFTGQRFWRGDLSPSKRLLAVARNRRGFSIHRLDTDGAVVDSRECQFNFDHVEDVAWLTDHLLAVGDSDGDVGFFVVEDSLEATLRHEWLLDANRPAALSAVEARGTDLAVGYRNGRFVILDGAVLRTGWLFR